MTVPAERRDGRWSFRAFRDGDEGAVAALLDEDVPPLYRWALHSLHGPGRDEPTRWRTEVAVEDGEVVGAVTAAHHSVHRGQYVLAITVAAAHRRRGLGRALAAEGHRMRAEPLPMTTRFVASDRAGAAFVRSLGAEIIQTDPRLSFDPAALRDWAGAQPVPSGATVGDLTGVPAAELVANHRERYLWQHEDWCPPPVWLPGVTAHAERTVAVLRRELSSGARIDGRLAAAAYVFDDPGGQLTLIAETTRPAEPDGIALVAAVVADAVRRAADSAEARVEIDHHVTDPHMHPVTLTFPAGVDTDPLHVARFTAGTSAGSRTPAAG